MSLNILKLFPDASKYDSDFADVRGRESPEASQLGDELEVDILGDLAPLAIPL
jgi:hypothetical protein